MTTSMNITNIPATRVAFIDPRTGLMAREWYRFFLNLFVLTGGGTSDTAITDLAVAPQSQGIADTDPNLGFQTQLASLQSRYDDIVSSFLDPIAFGNPRQEIGTLAAQNADRVAITGGTATLSAATITAMTTGGGAVFQTTNTALTDGAGAALGTLATAPAAGNPTKWIGINDNGTTRYIPAW